MSASAACPPRAEANRPWRTLVALAIGVALAGAVWSLFSDEGCFGCSEKGRLIGRLPLAHLGAAFYAALLAGLLLGRGRPVLNVLVQAAAAAHLLLLGLLAFHRLWCPPCVLTGAGAVSAAILLYVERPSRLRVGALLVPAVVILANLGLAWSREEARTYRTDIARDAVLELVEELGPAPEGRVRLVAYERPGCHWCDVWRDELLPDLERRYPGELLVSSRPAWEGLPTPTVLVQGRGSAFYPQLPPPAELAQSIDWALGRGEYAPGPTSRGHRLDDAAPR